MSFLRGNCKKDIPNEILHLQKKLNNNYLETLNEEDAIIFMKETYELLKKHKIKDDEAIQILK